MQTGSVGSAEALGAGRRFAAAVSSFLVVAAVALSGCASSGFGNQSYLYNAEKDKQGQAALKAATDAKLAVAIDAVEKRNAQVLALEIEAARTRYASIRDLEIREIAFSDKKLADTWLARMTARLARIYGSTDLQPVLDAQRALGIEERNLENGRNAVELVAGPLPDCAFMIANPRFSDAFLSHVPADRRVFVQQSYSGLRNNCSSYENARKRYDDALRKAGDGSLLAAAIKQRDGDVNARAGANKIRNDALAELGKAKAAYNEALQRLPGETNYAEKVAAAAEKLRKAVEGIESTQKALTREVVAKERLDAIEDILNAVAGGNVDTSTWDPELRKAVAVAGSLPALADEASRMLREAARPRLIPFELARQQQLLVVEEANKANAVIDARVQAAEDVVKAYAAEGRALLLVRQKAEPWRGKTLEELLANQDTKQRRAVFEQLGVYFDDVPRYQLEERLAEARRLGTLHDEVIVHSRYAALMWQNLNEGIAATLAGYHGAGIKPETVVEFLKALGIIAIGVGVN